MLHVITRLRLLHVGVLCAWVYLNIFPWHHCVSSASRLEGVSAVYLNLQGGKLLATPRNITSAHLDVLFKFKSANTSAVSHVTSAYAKAGEMHICSDVCSSFEYIFSVLSAPRPNVKPKPRDATREPDPPQQRTDTLSSACQREDPDHLRVVDDVLKDSIIAEWEDAMSMAALAELVCAVCARCTPPSNITVMHPANVDFHLLRNNLLPEHVLPMSYNRTAYDGAILHPKGLLNLQIKDGIRVCAECQHDLEKGDLPKYALANWLYYGHERLPEDVKQAFEGSTQVERMLYSRARASKISYRFSDIPGHPLEGTDRQTSQRCTKGNIAIHPQDATHLNDVLPPCPDVIQSMVCAVFIGKSKPTAKNIEGLRPVLVQKSRVSTVINFLTGENSHYTPDRLGGFQGFSQENLDQLFGPNTTGVNEGVPCTMEIGHIEVNGAVEGATDNYVPGAGDVPTASDTEDLMESVGYVDADNAPRNHKEMSMQALLHCLKGGSFLQSQAGSALVPDFHNPALLSWLFPHLDPWGIGGFHEPQRIRYLSLDQQLKYLLMVDGSPFRNDPDFAFVYYNISQKKAVYDSVSFRVSASQRERVVADLLRVNVQKLDQIAESFKLNPAYKPRDDEEKGIMRLLQQVNTVSYDVPGSNGHKLAMRNQIRGLINFQGPPTLFIMLNPSDRDHPLVRFYAGHEIGAEPENHLRGDSELSRWQRGVIAANNPSACAKFFDKMM
ncbi:hypothetical protein OH76DRAFT_1359002, partial [Lentinus brumalis]